MAGRSPVPDITRNHVSEELDGGFAPDTMTVTTGGLRRVDELSVGETAYSLDLATNKLTKRRVVDIRRVRYEGPLVNVRTKRCDFLVHPDHLIPYCTKSTKDIRFRRAGDLVQQTYYKFVNRWGVPSSPPLGEVDITDLIETYEIRAVNQVHGHTFRASLPEECIPCRVNSHTGYYFDPETFKQYQRELEESASELFIVGGKHQRGRPYRFRGDDFVEFLGWFITEGSVTWKKTRNTGSVQFAQEKPIQREKIEALLDRMGFSFEKRERVFRFGSELYARLLNQLCGRSSRTMHLPDIVWSLSPDQLHLLFDTLMAGDGNERGTYYTISSRLANDLCQLVLYLGMKPRYIRRGELWELFHSRMRHGFSPKKHLSTKESTGCLYQLRLEDGSTVMAGRDGRFQWCGTGEPA